MTTKLLSILFAAIFSFTLISSRLLMYPELQNSEKLLKDDLSIQILEADKSLFKAFNVCDSGEYKKYFTDDLEFYHDLGGLTVLLEKEMQSFKDMCARGTKMRRELIESDIEIVPLKDFGAVQTGSHNFYYTNKGEQETLGGTYKFVHVWKNTNEGWKISRVISYGHKMKK